MCICWAIVCVCECLCVHVLWKLLNFSAATSYVLCVSTQMRTHYHTSVERNKIGCWYRKEIELNSYCKSRGIECMQLHVYGKFSEYQRVRKKRFIEKSWYSHLWYITDVCFCCWHSHALELFNSYYDEHQFSVSCLSTIEFLPNVVQCAHVNVFVSSKSRTLTFARSPFPSWHCQQRQCFIDCWKSKYFLRNLVSQYTENWLRILKSFSILNNGKMKRKNGTKESLFHKVNMAMHDRHV